MQVEEVRESTAQAVRLLFLELSYLYECRFVDFIAWGPPPFFSEHLPFSIAQPYRSGGNCLGR